MEKLTMTVIPFCLGAIITRSWRNCDYFSLFMAIVAFIANIAVCWKAR